MSPAMRVFSADRYTFPLPAGHRFPITKYAALRAGVEAIGLRVDDPPLIARGQLETVHAPTYLDAALNGKLSDAELRRIGLPWSPEVVVRARRSSGATLAAARFARKDGVSVNLAGGTHHAQKALGAGFCLFNDAAVAISVLQQEGLVGRGGGRCLILDCDVHQGDGTAAIFATDPTVVILDLYCARNFPFRKVAATIDVPLEEGLQGAGYLDALHGGLAELAAFGPFDLAIYLAGGDPHEHDKLGRLALTTAAMGQRDEAVLDWLEQRGIPTVVTMAGGYPRRVQDVVDVHVQTVELAWASWRRRNSRV